MAGAVTALCALFTVLLTLKAFAAVGIGGAFGWRDGSVCASGPHTHGGAEDWFSQAMEPRPGVEVSLTPECCDGSPSGGARLLSTLTELPSSALYIGALFLLSWLIRAARQNGPYTFRTAGRLRILGWYLAVGSVVCHVAESVAGAALLNSLRAAGHRPLLYDVTHGMPYFVILTGVGLLSLARIMRVGTEMREVLGCPPGDLLTHRRQGPEQE
ncbi:Protein of unknown function [Streptomyces sp. yr375]|uniref:DUF2975 domain-containing protein n=1 Tax=Streptomyces sp. yr375 TaxID=1761906 RepID=UPI0008C9646A|nr:DUF2975 domain-containing protein [Streptomyces sp. yr375]SER99571.1 Protein of unknown function [Streptomyces sp. yr375]